MVPLSFICEKKSTCFSPPTAPQPRPPGRRKDKPMYITTGDIIQTTLEDGTLITVTIEKIHIDPTWIGEGGGVLIYFHHEPSGKDDVLSLYNLQDWFKRSKWTKLQPAAETGTGYKTVTVPTLELSGYTDFEVYAKNRHGDRMVIVTDAEGTPHLVPLADVQIAAETGTGQTESETR